MDSKKERPIIFNAQEVIAVLAGDKTQHRVIAKAEPTDNPDGYYYDGDDGEYAVFSRCVSAGNISLIRIDCPFGQIGDRLWVQEFHARTDRNMHFTAPHYYAEGPLTLDLRHDAGLLIKYSAADMPRWASRLLLEITDIRIERVQDIAGGDSLKEACDGLMDFAADYWMPKHGEAAWFKNPWVWVIEFKVIKENNDG